MSIMDMFRTAKQPEPMAGSKQQEDAAAKKAADDAAAAEAAKKSQAPESPLDKFSGVFNTDGKDESAGPMFNIDPAKLTEQASKTNFVGSIPPEVMAKIAAGGEEGAKAAMSAVNHVAQTSYAQSTLVAAKLVEAALEKQGKHYEEVVIPQLVKNLGVQQSLQDNNPALNHPAIAPVAAAVRDQLSKQHPEASQKEIAAMTQDYMSAFAQAVNPPKETTQQGGRKAKEVDWSTFLSN